VFAVPQGTAEPRLGITALHVLGSSSAHHQEFIYCTLGTGICHTGLKTAFEQNQGGWWAEELPETCRVSCRSKFRKLVHLVGFIIKKSVGRSSCRWEGRITLMRGIQYVMQWTAVKCLRLRTVVQARRGKVAGHKITEYLEMTCRIGIIGLLISWNIMFFLHRALKYNYTMIIIIIIVVRKTSVLNIVFCLLGCWYWFI